MTNPVTEAKARTIAAMEAWREARKGVNDPTSIPARLDDIVAIAERTISVIDQDIVTEVEAIVVELSALRFPVDPDEALSALEKATLALDGALGRIARAAARAGFAAADDDLGLPPGMRVPVKEIADQLDAFVAAVEGVKPVLEKIAAAQSADSHSNPKQAAIVQNLIEKASVKVEIIGVKTGKVSLVDVSGLSGLAQQLKSLLQSFATLVTAAAGEMSIWLADVPKSIGAAIQPLAVGTSRLVRKAATWIRRKGESDPPVADTPETATKQKSPGPAGLDLLEVERMIERGEVPPSEAIPFVTSFVASKLDSKAAAALSHMTGLRKLTLNKFKNVDLSSLLLGLGALQFLNLTHTRVESLSPLAGLTALQTLNLTRTRFKDLSPLAGLAVLRSLNLSRTQASDLSPLASLTALRDLSVQETPVNDLSPLAGLTALQSLNASRTQVNDVSPLAHLTALKSLNLNKTQVRDLLPLAHLYALQELSICDTQVVELSSLAGLISLNTLKLEDFRAASRTKVRDLSPLQNLPNLQYIEMKRDVLGPHLVDTLGMPGDWVHYCRFRIKRR